MGDTNPEVWLRGPLADYPPELMPLGHGLLQIREELEAVRAMRPDEFTARIGGAASVAFHVAHLAGSLDRLLTYARGEALSDRQQAALAGEPDAPRPGETPAAVVAAAQQAIDRALAQIRATSTGTLDEPRRVGRAGLPSSVRGLLFHAVEHGQRHAGQIATMMKIACRVRER